MKTLFLLAIFSFFYHSGPNDQKCTGNACDVITATPNPYPNIPWKFQNNSNKSVKLGIRVFSGSCGNALYYTIKPHSSINWGINRQTYCLPYEANFN
jgi:hypothetical protein